MKTNIPILMDTKERTLLQTSFPKCVLKSRVSGPCLRTEAAEGLPTPRCCSLPDSPRGRCTEAPSSFGFYKGTVTIFPSLHVLSPAELRCTPKPVWGRLFVPCRVRGPPTG